ncbi:MAG: hypothetical protein AAFO89_09875, partial [Planctomycetota bacterium]
MFEDATSFDHDLGGWEVRALLTGMFDNSGLSPNNYDATLDGWANQDGLPPNIRVGAEGLKYCDVGAAARSELVGDLSWRFEGDSRGSDEDCDP